MTSYNVKRARKLIKKHPEVFESLLYFEKTGKLLDISKEKSKK